VTSPEVAAAARRGARSLRFRGWIAAECEEAAVEEVVRRQVVDVGDAWRVGRTAAIDEIRRLTHHRRTGPRVTLWPLEFHDEPADEPGFRATDEADALRRRMRRLSKREAEVVAHLAAGMSNREVARRLGVDPSRVTQIKRQIRQKW
jgi:RNA polymerase sigma factor (sigma-70 family)